MKKRLKWIIAPLLALAIVQPVLAQGLGAGPGLDQWDRRDYIFLKEYPGKVQGMKDQLATLKQGISLSKDPKAAAKRILLLEAELEMLEKDRLLLEGDADELITAPHRIKSQDYEKEAEELEKEGYRPPTEGVLTSPYGWRIHPVTNQPKIHKGYDLANDEGTVVRAARSGVVMKVDYNDISGNQVFVRHCNGQVTAYFHLLKVTCQEGQPVLAGEPIALMGTTGRSTGSHLHFELRILGKTVDPEPYIFKHRRRVRR